LADRIADYGMIGDCEAAALVARNGSIDWLCLRRFDSDSCFAALLGEPKDGRWQIAPRAPAEVTDRRYREGTLILETTFTNAEGSVRLIDFMPPKGQATGKTRSMYMRATHRELHIRDSGALDAEMKRQMG
jgi:GH15 family glucan-1,4-alpha-glucosidase